MATPSYTPLRTGLAVLVIGGALAGEWYVAATERHDEVTCQPTGSVTPLQGLPEASGLAVSRRTPGVLWSINDSGDPMVTALDTSGGVKGRVRIAGAEVTDWEDVTTASCGRGSCLYVADIGDNDRKRAQVIVYRVPEPSPGDMVTAPAETFTAAYPDGPHDAEALFVGADGAVFIVTKDKPAVVFRFPSPMRAGTTMRLEQAGTLPIDSVTDAETSRDGEWIAVRTKTEVVFFRREEFALGVHGAPIEVEKIGEPQGEGIAMAPNGTVYLAGEGKKREAPGTLAAMQCTFPRGASG